MRFAVFGTGMVGQVLAGKLSELGHEVTVGTRDVEATSARTEPGPWETHRSHSGGRPTPTCAWRRRQTPRPTPS
jgi:ketopantoate reductase